MRIIVGWEEPRQAETIGLILNVDENEAHVFTDHKRFDAALGGGWDVVLLSLDFPDQARSFSIFKTICEIHPETPVVGAWKPGEIDQLAKCISAGMHSHVMRDGSGDFVFLLTTILEAAQAAMQSQRARVLAERLREEVDSVRRLQESVIPQDLPILAGYKVVARYEPSQIRVVGSKPVVMAGGDYYDAFALDNSRLVLLVGDASGHGVKACMSIMTMHTLIRMIRNERYPNTAAFVEEVNRRLCTSEIVHDEGGFITLCYSNLDTGTHELQWTCAGQPMPLLQDLDTNEVRPMATEDEGGLPLAIDENWDYLQCLATIPNNSRVLIYTDGLEDAFPADGDIVEDKFGMPGIIHSLKSSVHLPLHLAMNKLFADSNAATRGAGRHDDTSVVLVERKDEEQSEE